LATGAESGPCGPPVTTQPPESPGALTTQTRTRLAQLERPSQSRARDTPRSVPRAHSPPSPLIAGWENAVERMRTGPPPPSRASHGPGVELVDWGCLNPTPNFRRHNLTVIITRRQVRLRIVAIPRELRLQLSALNLSFLLSMYSQPSVQGSKVGMPTVHRHFFSAQSTHVFHRQAHPTTSGAPAALNLRRTSCPAVPSPTSLQVPSESQISESPHANLPHRCRHLGPGPARSRSAQPARSIPTLPNRLGSNRARSPSGSCSSLSDQAELQGLQVKLLTPAGPAPHNGPGSGLQLLLADRLRLRPARAGRPGLEEDSDSPC
jgi:hypothetical protein